VVCAPAADPARGGLQPSATPSLRTGLKELGYGFRGDARRLDSVFNMDVPALTRTPGGPETEAKE